MKSAEIRTGVVYARWPTRHAREPEPVVFLSTSLYQRPPAAGTGWIAEARAGSRACSGYRTTTGYVAVSRSPWCKKPYADLIEPMLQLTIGDAIAVSYGGRIGEDLQAEILTSADLGYVRGFWQQECEAAKAAQAEAERRAAEYAEVIRKRESRGHVVTEVLAQHGIRAAVDERRVNVTLRLADAEKLAALLRDRRGLTSG